MASDARNLELASRLRAGDRSSWNQLGVLLLRFLKATRAPLQGLEEDEVVCDALSSVWEGLGRLREDATILTYSRTVARRLSGHCFRRQQQSRSLEYEPSVPDDAPSKKVEAEELMEAILSSIEGANCELFRLLYVVGADPRAVREALGCTARELRKRKQSLHARLREALLRYERGAEPRPSRKKRRAARR
jgi:DNA-directed RNA polymerase specialized sigma24 family protein